MSFLSDSYDDLETTLDRALHEARGSLFGGTRHSSSGNNAIPMTSFGGRRGSAGGSIGGDDNYGYGSQDGDDAPLLVAANGDGGNSGGGWRKRLINWMQTPVTVETDRYVSARGDSRAMHTTMSSQTSSQNPQVSTNSLQSRANLLQSRTNLLRAPATFPSNAVSNAKYNPFTFVPIVLYEQFKFFFNLYFLVVALSQAVPALRIGYLSSYVVPLGFVLTVTMVKEAADDIARRRRDVDQNSERFEVLNRGGTTATTATTATAGGATAGGATAGAAVASGGSVVVRSRDLQVGDVVRVHKGARVPADLVLLQSSDKNGEAFIKTDQLDGETDWKLRVAPAATQTMLAEQLCRMAVVAGPPSKLIHQFMGKLVVGGGRRSSTANTANGTANGGGSGSGNGGGSGTEFPLSLDQTLWANTVVATGAVLGIVVYTGPETRLRMNTSNPGVKTGILELEINRLAKVLCVTVFVLSVVLVAANGWPPRASWYVDMMRYLILFLSIIPVSLRVNLDLAKSVYGLQIHHDAEIPGTVVRTSTIPEDLGRIEYLLTDKTGTLTQNDMILKKLHLGAVSYAGDTLDMVADAVAASGGNGGTINGVGGGTVNGTVNSGSAGGGGGNSAAATGGNTGTKKRDLGLKVYELVMTLALCHNVTPMEDEDGGSGGGSSGTIGGNTTSYQAASPDEIAIVKFAAESGLCLVRRDRGSMAVLHRASGAITTYEILHMFPFNSDTKRMGIVVRDSARDEIVFLEKGADLVMGRIVVHSEWLDEEVGNMAREGLRTLVVGRKRLTAKTYHEFARAYHEASLAMYDREAAMQAAVQAHLEVDLELMGLTGVEDKLQHHVNSSIEVLRHAGVKIWMLTGDKVETAKCVAISCRLISRGQFIHQIVRVGRAEVAEAHLDAVRNNSAGLVLLIDGESLAVYQKYFWREFLAVALKLPAVVACRCSPQQKADIARAIKFATGKRICCIGDGGNDVSMIQAADVGVGIVGKEGRQASLAADFSVDQFYYVCKLMLWHGRNSYNRLAVLGQFIMHRGLIISVCQAVFLVLLGFEPVALFEGFLVVGYATIYTMMPVFAMTLDCDVDERLARLYPELYRELAGAKVLGYRAFLGWVVVLLYQGAVIQAMAQYFGGVGSGDGGGDGTIGGGGGDGGSRGAMVAVSYTALIFNELMMVALQVHVWTKVMMATVIVTVVLYVVSVPMLGDYFDQEYVGTFRYIWQTVVILAVSLVPVWAIQAVNRRMNPPTYAKVQDR